VLTLQPSGYSTKIAQVKEDNKTRQNKKKGQIIVTINLIKDES
jgi:hypothetical protein